MSNEIKEIYDKISNTIIARLEEFENIWKNASNKEVFIEMAFCILTPQSKAKNAWQAISTLVENNLLFEGTPPEICEYLNIVRFKNRKSEYLVTAREQFFRDGDFRVREILEEFSDPIEKREWLVKNVKGYGYKEASHFLRNVGFGDDIAILDRHILRNLVLNGVIEEMPKSITGKKYCEIEEKMKKFAKSIDLSMAHLDLVWWYREAGEVFK